ncbi:MAG: alpha/beta hydrolase [Rubrobacter sp.]|nr:alpha/beta hydrolase [Rubrobacter sp.]
MKGSLRRVSLRAGALAVLLALAYLAIGYVVAAQLTAPDTVAPERTPAEVGLDFREVDLRSTDGVDLAGWWVPEEDSSRAVVLVHGWGGDKSNDPVVETAPVYAGAEYNVLMLDLRGHGVSESDRRTLGYREVRDVRGALSWLGERGFGAKDVTLHGFSMGAATVVRSAPGSGVAAVVADSGYADLPLLLREELPETSGLPGIFNPGIFLAAYLFLDFDVWDVRPEEEASRLSGEGVPLFVIHSRDDEVVPFENSGMFLGAYPGAVLWELEDAGHIGAYKEPDYEERLLEFLEATERRDAAQTAS